MSRTRFPGQPRVPTEWRTGGHTQIELLLAHAAREFDFINRKIGEVVSVKADFGAVGDGATDDTEAIQEADDAAGDGGTVFFPTGTYLWSGDLTPGRNRIWMGSGIRQHASKLKAADSNSRLLLTNAALLWFFYVEGSSIVSPYVGTGIQVGDTAFVGHVGLHRVFVRYFQTNLRLAAALWTTVRECQFDTGRYGVDFNAGSASVFSTTVSFYDCVFANNERNGIAATNTPLDNLCIQFFGGTCQNNATESNTYPHLALPNTTGFGIRGMYFEPPSGTAGKMMDLSDMEGGEVRGCYSQGFDSAVYASNGTLFDTEIKGNYFAAVAGTNCIDITGATRVEVSSIRTNKPIVLTGAKCINGVADEIVVQPIEQGTFTPTLIGSSTPGAQTYSTQTGSYNKIGNQIFFRGRVTITAKDGAMAGNVQIALGDLPASIVDNQAFALVEVEPSAGVTFSAGYTQLNGQISSAGSNKIDVNQIGSGVNVLALPVSGIANATTFRFSGVYTAAETFAPAPAAARLTITGQVPA